MKNKDKDNCIAFIFARGGSKGVPGKNIRELGGLPLIAYSIKVAHECPSISRVVVSTDDEKIADVAREHGAEVPFIRPTELARDDSIEHEAWQHAIKAFEQICAEKVGVFVSLPPTSPLRSVDDVENCIREYLNSDADVVITVKNASRNPYFNMVKTDEEGFSHLVNVQADGTRYTRRQDVPEIYDMTTVAYVTNPDYILNSESIFSGNVRSVLVPDERAVDIDTMLDFQFAEFLLTQGEKT